MKYNILHPALTSNDVNLSYIRKEDRERLKREKEAKKRVGKRLTHGYRKFTSRYVLSREPFCCPICMRVWEEYTENNKRHQLSYYAGLSTYGLFRMVCPECKETSQ
jgi:hypothetical protein